MMKTIEFITSNEGKAIEVASRFKTHGYQVVQKQYDYPEIQADTHREVVEFGLEYIIDKYDIKNPLLIDDSGLYVQALNGFPGVYSAYVLRTIGYPGILKIMSGIQDRKAYFEACLGYKEPGKDAILAFGRVDGEISQEPMEGTHGFGFDPVFVPYIGIGKLADVSFAQMEINEKNKYSHRSKAITDLINKMARAE